jgi:hypothetical protein
MNLKHFHFIALALAFIALPASISAGEIYMWIDKDGTRHASTSPPPSMKGIKMIDQMSHRRDSPQEIRQYEMQQKLKQRLNLLESERQRGINQARESAKRSQEQLKQDQKDAELRRAKEALAFEEKYQKRYEDQRRNSTYQWRIDLYDDLKRQQDKDVEEKRRKVMELENK